MNGEFVKGFFDILNNAIIVNNPDCVVDEKFKNLIVQHAESEKQPNLISTTFNSKSDTFEITPLYKEISIAHSGFTNNMFGAVTSVVDGKISVYSVKRKSGNEPISNNYLSKLNSYSSPYSIDIESHGIGSITNIFINDRYMHGNPAALSNDDLIGFIQNIQICMKLVLSHIYYDTFNFANLVLPKAATVLTIAVIRRFPGISITPQIIMDAFDIDDLSKAEDILDRYDLKDNKFVVPAWL